MFGLNLGCGPIMLKQIDGIEFLNIDNDEMYMLHAQQQNARFKVFDLRNGLSNEIVTEPVSFVNMSQFLEHLNLPYAEKLLFDCINFMENGGIIRISVPDLELLLYHLRTNKMDIFEEQQPPEWFKRYSSQAMKFSLLLFGSLDKDGSTGHKMCYDFEALKELLEKVGFTDVKRCEFDPRFDAPVAQNHQLCVQAVKK